MSTLAIAGATGALAFTTGLLTTVPLIRRLHHQLAAAVHDAQHDQLTGLPNRAYAEQLFATRHQVVVALIDLDRFKDVNDTYGHQAGDELLTAVGPRLASVAGRAGGFAARLAGDEFLLILPVHSGDHLHPVAVSLLALAQPATITGADGSVTIRPRGSAGLTTVDPLTSTFTSALREADIALYHAKTRPGTYEVYKPGMHMPVRKHRHGPRLRDQRVTGHHAVRGEVSE